MSGALKPEGNHPLISSFVPVAWAAVIAGVTGFAACLGWAYEVGQNGALGVSALSLRPLNATLLYTGFLILLDVALPAFVIIACRRIPRAIPALAIIACRRVLRGEERRLICGFLTRVMKWLRKSTVQIVPWCVAVFLVAVAALLFNHYVVDYPKESAGPIMSEGFDEPGVGHNGRIVWVYIYDHAKIAWICRKLLGAGIAVIILSASYLTWKNFEAHKIRNSLFGVWALLEALSLLTNFATLRGISNVGGRHDVVRVSIQKSDSSPLTVNALRIAEDEKQLAFFVLPPAVSDTSGIEERKLVFVQRADVKAITVVCELTLNPKIKYSNMSGNLCSE